jgi:hypothetical protein
MCRGSSQVRGFVAVYRFWFPLFFASRIINESSRGFPFSLFPTNEQFARHIENRTICQMQCLFWSSTAGRQLDVVIFSSRPLKVGVLGSEYVGVCLLRKFLILGSVIRWKCLLGVKMLSSRVLGVDLHLDSCLALWRSFAANHVCVSSTLSNGFRMSFHQSSSRGVWRILPLASAHHSNRLLPNDSWSIGLELVIDHLPTARCRRHSTALTPYPEGALRRFSAPT